MSKCCLDKRTVVNLIACCVVLCDMLGLNNNESVRR